MAIIKKGGGGPIPSIWQRFGETGAFIGCW